MQQTLLDYLNHWSEERGDQVWLRDRVGDEFTEWTWREARADIQAIGAALEKILDGHGNRVGILSRNRAHWILSDLGAISAGQVTIPMFTTLAQDTARYVMEFTDMQLLFVGESENWASVAEVLPEGITLVALPGVELEQEHLKLEDLITAHQGQSPTHSASPESSPAPAIRL